MIDGHHRTPHERREGVLLRGHDAFSRRIIGWSIADHMRTELVCDALGMAILRRHAGGGANTVDTILHSDHGTQFTSWAFGQRLRDAGLLPSMGTIGDCYHNSMMEPFWGTLQLEILDSHTWETRPTLANAIFEWDRMLVQYRTPPFQHRNAPPGPGLRRVPDLSVLGWGGSRVLRCGHATVIM